jgi:predicted DNA-binding transcriptional regulator AlpA
MAITDTHDESATAEAPKTKKRRKQHVRQAPTLPLPLYLRVPDLIDMGVIKSWTDLVRLIAEHGFPAGILLSPKVRVWRIEEIKAWLDSRPVKIERRHLQTTSRA